MSEGQALYATHCAGCHAADGSGAVARATGQGVPAPDLRRPGSLIDQTDAQLLAVVTGGAGAAMPAFGSSLDESQRWAVVTWVRVLSLGGLSAPADAPAATAAGEPPASVAARASAAVVESHALLDQAIAARRRGEVGAGAMATDAYMRFEPIEKRVGAVDPAAVTHVEEGFVRVRNALREPGTAVSPALEAGVAELHRHLDAAAGVLDASGGALGALRAVGGDHPARRLRGGAHRRRAAHVRAPQRADGARSVRSGSAPGSESSPASVRRSRSPPSSRSTPAPATRSRAPPCCSPRACCSG